MTAANVRHPQHNDGPTQFCIVARAAIIVRDPVKNPLGAYGLQSKTDLLILIRFGSSIDERKTPRDEDWAAVLADRARFKIEAGECPRRGRRYDFYAREISQFVVALAYGLPLEIGILHRGEFDRGNEGLFLALRHLTAERRFPVSTLYSYIKREKSVSEGKELGHMIESARRRGADVVDPEVSEQNLDLIRGTYYFASSVIQLFALRSIRKTSRHSGVDELALLGSKDHLANKMELWGLRPLCALYKDLLGYYRQEDVPLIEKIEKIEEVFSAFALAWKQLPKELPR